MKKFYIMFDQWQVNILQISPLFNSSNVPDIICNNRNLYLQKLGFMQYFSNILKLFVSEINVTIQIGYQHGPIGRYVTSYEMTLEQTYSQVKTKCNISTFCHILTL